MGNTIKALHGFVELARKVNYVPFSHLPEGIDLRDFVTGKSLKFEKAFVLKAGECYMILERRCADLGAKTLKEKTGDEGKIYPLVEAIRYFFADLKKTDEKEAKRAKLAADMAARDKARKAAEEKRRKAALLRRQEAADFFQSANMRLRSDKAPAGLFIPAEKFRDLASPAEVKLAFGKLEEQYMPEFHRRWQQYFPAFMEALEDDCPEEPGEFFQFLERFNKKIGRDNIPYLKASVISVFFGHDVGFGLMAISHDDVKIIEDRLQADKREYRMFSLIESFLYYQWMKMKEEKVATFPESEEGRKVANVFVTQFKRLGIES